MSTTGADDSFARLEQLFHEYRALPPTEREPQIDALRDEDPDLASQLSDLLAAESEADTFLDEGAGPLAGDRAGQPEVGDEIGGFRILSVLASGGMGVVYHAQQLRPERDVALKVVRSGVLGHDLLRRFELEADLLASFDHPGIASVLAAGVATNAAEEQVPYLAMEFIEGVVITDYVARRGATVREIVELVASVADAVGHAHRKGVIHRDLKPANVLVTSAGRPKVLDFGVARVVTTAGHAETLAGQIVGTPAYMSPEQASGDPAGVDTRTDVHALGLLLQELLSGRQLLDLDGLSLTEALAQVRSRRPETILRDERPIERDLQWIVDRAVAPDRSERYGTAQELADDLRRFLRHQPIEARPPSSVYVLRKLVRRNPFVSSLALLALGVLIVGFILVSRERDRADRNAARATREAAARSQSLDEIRRLSDVVRLRELIERALTAGPARPDTTDEIRSWLAEARALVKHLPEHEARLQALLEQSGVDWPDEALAADLAARRRGAREQLENMETSDVAVGRSPTELLGRRVGLERTLERARRQCDEPARVPFSKAELRWQYEVLRGLVTDLRRFTGPLGRLVEVERRLRTAEEIAELDVAQAAAWKAVTARLATDDRFKGLELRPQSGLVPLGRDPESELEEFLHWESHEGELPRRNATGRIPMTEETGIILVLLPGGVARIGASREVGAVHFDPDAQTNEMPIHEVGLHPFLMGKYEVTQGQWLRMTRDAPSAYRPPMELKGAVAPITWDHPVDQVTWYEARDGLRRGALQLPTEVQWEYAARAGATSRFPEGDDAASLLGMVNIADRSAREAGTRWAVDPPFRNHKDGYATHAPVGRYDANAFGLHDVCGNVWEWCVDGWQGYHRVARGGDGLRCDDDDLERILRGGSFSDVARGVRLSNRHRSSPDTRGHVGGFRAAASLR